MKKLNKMVLFAVLGMMQIVSCAKNGGQSTENSPSGGTQEAVQSDVKQESASGSGNTAGVSGVVYVNNAGLYTENDEGKMKWTAEAALGDKALYLGEKKEAVRTDGQKRTFFHIELNGQAYWIQEYSYEPDTVAAFISGQDVVLYKSESLAAMTDEFIPRYAIVAVYNDSLEKTNSKFIKIAAYNSELVTSWSIKDKYVKRDAVETDEMSVSAMILAQVAMESKNDTIRGELFQNAIEIGSPYSDTIAVLQSLSEIMIKEDNFMKELTTEKISEKVTAIDDINLLSIPDENDSRTVNMLKAGTAATATRKYVKQNADSENAIEWLYIQNKQKKGWVQADSVKIQNGQ
jgi:hypothetical protein